MAALIFWAFCLHIHNRIKPSPPPVYVTPPAAALGYAVAVAVNFSEKLIVRQTVERHEHAGQHVLYTEKESGLPWLCRSTCINISCERPVAAIQ